MSEPAAIPATEPAADPKWSDDSFLDRLRASTDDDANETVAHLKLHGDDLPSVNRVLRSLRSMDQGLPADAPQVFREFMDRHRSGCSSCQIDDEIIARGGRTFFHWAYPAAVVMLASSLPSGYSAPALSRVLTISDELAVHPYRRLLAVIQMLINISSPDHEEHPDAETSALKLRLLHAGVRLLVPSSRPGYLEEFGKPINHEDMLATIMGFSLLVLDGVRTLGFEIDGEDADAFWQMWRRFARLMGIVPDNAFEIDDFVPTTLADARAFYRSYQRRWFCHSPEENPDGVRLTERNRQMMLDLIPWPLRMVGLGRAPDILMTDLLGEEGLARLGMQPLVGHRFDHAMLHSVLRFGQDVSDVGDHFSSLFAATILKGMIKRGMGKVRFSVPGSVEALHQMAEPQRMTTQQINMKELEEHMKRKAQS